MTYQHPRTRRPSSQVRTQFIACLGVVALCGACSVAACSSSTDNPATTATTAGAGGNSTGPSVGGGGGLFGDAGNNCNSETCPDGVCTSDGSCCAEDKACNDTCCESAEICAFQSCVVPGDICVDASDCGPDEYCDYGLGETMGGGGAGPGCQGGVELQNGRCLPKPPECGPNQDPGDPPTCLEKCEYHPPTATFAPQEKFSWGSTANTTSNVMMAPVVTQLDDDNCDGSINERDIPDIVFFTFNGNDYNNNGGNAATLHAISIIDGAVVDKWSTATPGDYPGRSIAAGDIHPSTGNEIVVCTTDNRVRAYDSSGAVLWTSEVMAATCSMPSIADIDQDGDVEIIVRGEVLDGVTGQTQATFAPANTHQVVVSDVTGDNVLDVVSPTRVYNGSGGLILDIGITGNHAAVGDLDNDGIVEIVSVNSTNHSLTVWHIDPAAPAGYEIIRQNIDINGTISPNPCCAINPNSAGCTRGGGAPTIADFDGDGFADVGLAGGIGYVMFSGKKLMDGVTAGVDTIEWITPTQDCSSAQTGSSVFDFDGDGSAEVVYADETTLHIYSGVTGLPLFETCNTNGTLFEYPLVADVDNDGHADIVVASNSYSSINCGGQKTTGIRVFGDTEGQWVRTRRIWNQHSYHVTNVNEDGTIPQFEASNFLQPRLNNFRQNVQPLGEFSAPDLIISVAPVCGNEYILEAAVRNVGEASVPAGVLVEFFEGSPAMNGTKLGETVTTKPIYSLGVEVVSIAPASQPTALVYARANPALPTDSWHECREDNNDSIGVSPSCGPS